MLILVLSKLIHIFEKMGLIFDCRSIGSYRNFNLFLACKCNYTCLSVFRNRLRNCLHGNSSPYYNIHELWCALLQIQLRVFQSTLDHQASNALNTARNL
jgi:hypothetical protein